MKIDAKNSFREGWVMLNRPFDFAEFDSALSKLTLVYVYTEQPIITKKVKDEVQKELDDIYDPGFYSEHKRGAFESVEDYESRIAGTLKLIYDKKDNYDYTHEGNIVQCVIHGETCRFYPDEYNIIQDDTLKMAIEEDSYKMIVDNPNVFELSEIKQRIFYMRQRGINPKTALKYASFGLKDAIYYIPHPELSKLYCNRNEMRYVPEYEEYYDDVYGGYDKFLETI